MKLNAPPHEPPSLQTLGATSILAHLVELLMAPLLTSVSSLCKVIMVTVMKPMLKAEPLTAQQGGLPPSIEHRASLPWGPCSILYHGGRNRCSTEKLSIKM